jgi:hypothetical protein
MKKSTKKEIRNTILLILFALLLQATGIIDWLVYGSPPTSGVSNRRPKTEIKK